MGGVGVAGWRRTAFAATVSFVYFFPVLWIILTSFKTYEDALAVPAARDPREDWESLPFREAVAAFREKRMPRFEGR